MEKVKVFEEWIKVCRVVNILLYKLDNFIMRKFFDIWVVNGGVILKVF